LSVVNVRLVALADAISCDSIVEKSIFTVIAFSGRKVKVPRTQSTHGRARLTGSSIRRCRSKPTIPVISVIT